MWLFRKITELVDKDVASNSKPISMIGMVIPFLPFMLFVDGAPADTYPVMSFLALSVSILWGIFIGWRYFRYLRAEFSGGYSWLIGLGTVLFILIISAGYFWLSDKIGWPEAYGFNCHGRGCLLEDLANSPKLIQGGSVYELGLFALLWLLPTAAISLIVYALLKRLRQRNQIGPME